MRIALGIVKLFPEGGLQRDCVRLARVLARRGHDITLFTSENRWTFDDPPCRIVVLPIRALSNHGTDLKFATQFATATSRGFEGVVGFNKLIRLDVYYCADPPAVSRDRSPFAKLLPRHRTRVRLERACFGPSQHTHILALTQASADAYRSAWGTPAQRITVLQPSIDPARLRPDLRTATHRSALRARLGLSNEQTAWLWVGAQARVKGLDRALAALRSAPNTVLLAAGIAPDAKDAVEAARLVGDDRTRFLGFRDDIPELMAAADVLVHPSRLDVTGQVILEAIVNGLPAVITGLCGFAEHVIKAGAGIVLPEPFAQHDLDAALARMRDRALAEAMSRAGIRYGEQTAPISGLEQAADVIEAKAAR
jgi:UDP-glucose:(heptosyl)LPS alpha-1,3-glucosyltransferase